MLQDRIDCEVFLWGSDRVGQGVGVDGKIEEAFAFPFAEGRLELLFWGEVSTSKDM